MKLNAIEKFEKPVGKTYYQRDASEMDMDARCYWILSIMGGLSLAAIWFISVFMIK